MGSVVSDAFTVVIRRHFMYPSPSIVAFLLTLMRRFGSQARGNVAIIFALSSVALAVGVGAGLDLSGAYAARQRLSEVATLTCQYSVRPSVVNSQGANGTFQTYLNTVNAYATNALQAQHVKAANVTGASGGSYFTATAGGNGPTSGVTDLTMAYPTAFMKIFNVNTISLHAHIGCETASTAPQVTTGSTVLSEGFETSCAVYCFTLPSGVAGALQNPTTTFGSTPTYTGSGGFSWYIIGYCLEVDVVGVINANDPEGTHSAELDCDNASHTAGNSSMSTKVYLQAGSYELRYFYRSRIDVPALDPYYVCGWSYNDPTKTDDLSWVNSTNFPTSGTTAAMRTNQMNVYLDPGGSTGYPPLHYTSYSNTPTQQLAGSNLIDSCVYSPKWVERSITITVTSSGYYWISFAADGQNDSFGAQLDDIRICPGTCAGTPQDNFPDTTPQTLPVLTSTQTTSLTAAIGGQLTWGWNKYIGLGGTFVSPMCGATATVFFFGSCSNLARSVGTNVLLDPGFYELTYQYASLATFSGAPSTGCTSSPTSSAVSAMQSKSVTATDPRVLFGGSYSTTADVDMTGVFLTFPGQTLTPNIGGTVAATNPLIDLCYYSTSTVSRKIGIQITKPGYYNLAYYAAGSASNSYQLGGAVGMLVGMSLLPLGSPYTLATASACPNLPVPAPQVGSAISGASPSGLSVAATDPFQFGESSSACAP